MAEFQQENPEFGSGLLSFALEYVLANTWPANSIVSDYNTCIVLCDADDVGTTRDCSCTCDEDFDTWSNDEVGIGCCCCCWLQKIRVQHDLFKHSMRP